MADNDALWPSAAVFDCDGLLVDSTHCWHDAYAVLAEEMGGSIAEVDLPALAGASVRGAATLLAADLGAAVAESRLRQLLRDSFVASPPRPMGGAQALVRACAARGPVGVASNAPLDILDTVLAGLGLSEVIDAVVSAEQTPAEKPAPDVYLEACRQLDVHPSDAIAFEDSPLGAEAARAAGLFLVAVPSSREMAIEADLTVRSLADRRLLEYLKLDAADGPVVSREGQLSEAETSSP